MVNTYLTERKQLAGVVVIVDSRRRPTELDENLIKFLQFRGFPFVVALSKADKIGHSERTTLMKVTSERFGPERGLNFFLQ